MFCSNCGNEISEEMTFCPKCGKKTEKVKNDVITTTDAEEKPTTALSQEEKYKVIIEYSDNKTGIVQIIQQVKKVDLATAKNIAKRLPLTLFVHLTREEAEEVVKVCKKSGVVAVAKSENEENPFKDFEGKEPNEEIEKIERKNQIKKATIIELISTVLGLIAVLFVIFLPLFFNRVTEVVEEESVIVEKGYSLFDMCYAAIERIFGGDFNFTTYYVLFDFVRLIIAIWAIALVVGAAKKTVEQVKNLVEFEKYYKREEKGFNGTEVIKQLQTTQNGNWWYQLASELIVLFILGGFDGIVVGSIVVVGVMMVAGFVLEKVAKSQKKKVFEN
ncbi:MAG: zinc ribbon domain-containing protein [Clostridia bacterium]|nr:zinc ribbon domain-containing protein [Clostridia bacterium]